MNKTHNLYKNKEKDLCKGLKDLKRKHSKFLNLLKMNHKENKL